LNAYVPEFELSVTMKDATACVSILKKMLPALSEEWDYNHSILYQHLNPKEEKPKEEKSKHLGQLILFKILKELKDPNQPEYDFLQNSKEFQTLLASYEQLAQ